MSPCFIDLSARTKLQVTGADRLRFLNGQTTNDLRKASEHAAQESCICNAKGHLEAHIFVVAGPDAFWVDASENLRDNLPARLERYIIADDVAVEDVTARFALFHFLGNDRPDASGARFIISSQRLAGSGWDIWVSPEEKETVRRSLHAVSSELDQTGAERLRIEQGIPGWGKELTPEIIPSEAGLEARAIDYAKGCYIGQEVISRVKMSGQLRQRLCGVRASEELVEGMQLDAAGKLAGRITSATVSENAGGFIGLAIVKRGFTAAGSELRASTGDRVVPVTLCSLPFAEE